MSTWAQRTLIHNSSPLQQEMFGMKWLNINVQADGHESAQWMLLSVLASGLSSDEQFARQSKPNEVELVRKMASWIDMITDTSLICAGFCRVY